MMYAFIEDDEEKTIEYYMNALKNLAHIKYYYGFLIYQFECLLGKTDGEYNEDNYPLPEELNFSEYITFMKKQLNLK